MMLYYRLNWHPDSGETIIETNLKGELLLNTPQLNKGTAFSLKERKEFGLLGKLPDGIENLEQQVARTYLQLCNHDTRLRKYIFLNSLHDKNQVLFYRLLANYLEELLPIIYTPTVGTAVKTFSQKFRRPRGLYISYDNRHVIEAILENFPNNIGIIVATDGQGVLGIGDQGIGAMDIPIAKLAVYTILGGVNPHYTLPVMLDVGTDNPKLLADPMYLGLRRPRIGGKAYDDFIALFVAAIKRKFPNIFLHWEDLGRNNAARILKRYRHSICTFNDDIQGTGIVALAAIMAALKITKQTLVKQRIIIFGGGTAGLGIADAIHYAMLKQGISKKQATACFWIIDKSGLLLDNATDLTVEQQIYARPHQEVLHWQGIDLGEVVTQIKPTVLIGCSGVAHAFNKTIVTTMAKQVTHPVIMPLSNPNQKAEATPQDLLNWTQGQALIATGSPFDCCSYGHQKISIPQCNNALIFPALGLAAVAIKAKQLSQDMSYVASVALAKKAPITTHGKDSLLPSVSDVPRLTKDIAFTIAKQAVKEQHCQPLTDEAIYQRINTIFWQPQYLAMKLVRK